ncbi:lipoyl synthase [bacterium]|nr:lipoyl synthase [bacterium]
MPKPKQLRRPDWLKVKLETGDDYKDLKELVGDLSLNTVCQEAHCPNLHECWNARTATFMILGDICTRHCSFCSVGKGRPGTVDLDEPRRIGEAVKRMDCRHAVITSVDRDDLEDGGAGVWAATIWAVREARSGTTLEVLIPDFQGDETALATVMEARPEVLAHNVETVPELYRRVRPDANFQQSLSVLKTASRWKDEYPVRIKSGMMLGLGETRDQLTCAMEQLAEHRCEILTMGQYLPPTRRHLPVERFLPPEEFAELKVLGESLGLVHVEAGPFVRSSYRAERHLHV